MSLNIPVSYDDETRMLSVSEEWAGTTIDDRSTTFIVSGIPSNVKSAKLDVKVAVRSTKGKTIRPFMILKGIESGVGSATIPSVLLNACKRDRKFIFDLELMTEDETYASKNWITLKVSDAVFVTPSGMDQWNQDNVLVDAYEVQSEGKIVFKRFSGEEFAILLSDNDVSWEKIKNIPWRKAWSTGTPTDKDILCESLVKGELDKKTDITRAVPSWDEETTYERRSIVLHAHVLYESLFDDNKGHEVTDADWWSPISGGSEPVPGKGRYLCYIGNGTDTEFIIDHDLGSKILLYNLIDISSKQYIDANVEFISDIKVKVTFNEPPGINAVGAIFSTGAGGGGGGGDIQVITEGEIDALFGA